MAGIWDSNLKRLIGDNPEAFVKWLLPEATYVRELSQHLNRSIDTDILYEVILDGEKIVFHLEFQRNNNANMANRVLEYNVFASCKFDCTVVSFVIYLKKESKIVEPPLIRKLPKGQQILRLDFTNIKLWEIPTDELRHIGLVGLQPLLSLTKGGGRPEIVDEAIATIEQLEVNDTQKANLLSITLTLAALSFDKEEDRGWLRRRFQMYQDILRDSEIYQLIMREGQEKGREEEHQRRLQDQRQNILSFVQVRFPELVPLATQQLSSITDIELLQHLLLKVSLSKTIDEARQYLATSKKQKH